MRPRTQSIADRWARHELHPDADKQAAAYLPLPSPSDLILACAVLDSHDHASAFSPSRPLSFLDTLYPDVSTRSVFSSC